MSVHHAFEPASVPLVRLELASADVEVTTRDDPRLDVDVVALRDDEASLEAARAVEVELRERARPEVVIRQPKRSGRGFRLREPAIAIRIGCPEGSSVSCSSGSSDLRVRGPIGDLEVKTGSGDVQAEVVHGSLRASSASGDVELEAVHGDANVSTASGDVSIREAHGALAVNVVSGDISVGSLHGGTALGSVSGDVEVRALCAGDLKVQSVSGDLDIGVGPGLALWLDVSSVSGSTTSDLDLGETPAESGTPVELRARTVSGDIRVWVSVART
jgi:hypothetical protein